MSDKDLERRQEKKRKLSTKRGKASSAEKQASTRHGFGPDPAAQPVEGAFGKRGESLQRGWDPTRQPASPEGALLETDESPEEPEENEENDENDDER